jgi:hypothetical protein
MQNMPQHNPDLPPPAGRNGRYVRFRNQVYGLGLVFLFLIVLCY